MDGLPNATDAEMAQIPNYCATFHKWMLDDGKKEATAKSYVRQLALLFEDDGKSPSAMATQEYFDITKASFKNKSGNGQRSASTRLFMQWWNQYDHSKPLLDGSATKLYQVKGRPTTPSAPASTSAAPPAAPPKAAPPAAPPKVSSTSAGDAKAANGGKAGVAEDAAKKAKNDTGKALNDVPKKVSEPKSEKKVDAKVDAKAEAKPAEPQAEAAKPAEDKAEAGSANANAKADTATEGGDREPPVDTKAETKPEADGLKEDVSLTDDVLGMLMGKEDEQTDGGDDDDEHAKKRRKFSDDDDPVSLCVSSPTAYPEFSMDDCPAAITIESSRSHKFDGPYKRMQHPHRGRPSYVNVSGKKPAFLYWNKKWIIGFDFGSSKSYANVKDAGGLSPCEPYPNVWKVMEKKKDESEKREYKKNLPMRIIDEAMQDTTENIVPKLAEAPTAKRKKVSTPHTSKEAASTEDQEPKEKAAEQERASGSEAGAGEEQAGAQENEPASQRSQQSESESSVEEESDSDSSESSSSEAPADPSPKAAVRTAPPKPSADGQAKKAAELMARLQAQIMSSDPQARPVKIQGVRKMMSSNAQIALQVGQAGTAQVLALLDKLEKECTPAKPKPPAAPPPRWMLQQKGAGAEEPQVMAPQTPPEAHGSQVAGPLPSRGGAPVRSALKKSAALNRSRRIKIHDDTLTVRHTGVVSYRDCLAQLWYIAPGSLVVCDSCDREVPQAMGSMQGAPGQSQFAQNSFVCGECSLY